ncbi:MAG: S-layer homology domain-containing protein [Lawsonibacter sp.]|jgi:hypothetical protein
MKRDQGKEEKCMKKLGERILGVWLALILVFGMLPTYAWADGELSENVTVTIQFDYRSVGTEEFLTLCGLELPSDQTVTVPSGSTLLQALELAAAQGSYSMDCQNGYVSGFGGIGEIQSLCEMLLGTDRPDLFQYAGWGYTGDGVDGMGVAVDRLTQDGTITFRYKVYNSYNSQWEETNYDGPFVDGYYGLKEDLDAAQNLTEDEFSGDWQTLQQAIAQGNAVLTNLEQDEYLAGGMMLNYLAQQGTSLWGGENSPTVLVEGARRTLDSALRGEVMPGSITVPQNIELNLGQPYTLVPQVQPQGASQEVTYEAVVGLDSFTISPEGVITPLEESPLCMVQVTSKKNPSVSTWFRFSIVKPVIVVGDEQALRENIAARYTQSSSEWIVLDMGAYALLNPNGAALDSSSRQAYLDTTILALAGNPPIGSCAKAVLILSSQGVDPTQLTLIDGTVLNGVEALKGCTWDANDSMFIYTAPYVLLAYQQGNWDTQTQEHALVDYLLGMQQPDGSWDTTYGYDTMGLVMQGLAAYYGTQEQVTQALDRAVAYLATTIQTDGLFPRSYDPAYSAAEVAIGLCAIGVDPGQLRQGSDGMSLKEGILSKANADNTAFTYEGVENDGTTERCFRALLAMAGLAQTSSGYSVYDFTSVPKTGVQMTWSACPVQFFVTPSQAQVSVSEAGGMVSPRTGQLYDLAEGTYTYTVTCDGYTTKTGTFLVTAEEAASHSYKRLSISLTSGGQGGGNQERTVDVTVKVMVPPEDASREYTYKGDRRQYTNLVSDVSMPLTLPWGSTVRDALIRTLDQQDLPYRESNGYFSSIGGWEEADPDRWPTSGWLYMVNETVPEEAAANYSLQRDAEVTWFYTDNYSRDYGSETWSETTGTNASKEPEVLKGTGNTYQVILPEKHTGPVSVTIPQGKEGQLVVLVGKNGQEIPVKKAVVLDGSTRLLLEEDATVRLVDYTVSFSDVKETDWYAQSVAFVTGRELFSGVSEVEFAPQVGLTRGMLVTTLYALEEPDWASQKVYFSDVPVGAWYGEGVAWAAQEGIVTGYSSDQFGPNDLVTREQLAVILYRYAESLGMGTKGFGDLQTFEDETNISPWAREAVSWAVEAGILSGRTGGILDPNGSATRAEAAAMLQQFILQLVQ